ncbi:MAG: hypothetical protein ACE5DP_04150 [Fidelibacterota bacterium]
MILKRKAIPIPGHFFLAFLTWASFLPLLAQQIPVALEHEVNALLRRYAAWGTTPTGLTGFYPFRFGEIDTLLSALPKNLPPPSSYFTALQQRYQRQFIIQPPTTTVQGPWQKHNIANTLTTNLLVYHPATPEPRLITVRDSLLTAWVDWEETGSRYQQKTTRGGYFNDQLTINGQIFNRLSFLSQYSLFRLTNSSQFTTLPPEYKQGHKQTIPELNWLVWDQSQTTFYLESELMDLELSKAPIYWGFSPTHSPILSAQSLPFSYLAFGKTYRWFRFQSFHGSLLPYASDEEQVNLPEKNLAGHRFELTPTPNLVVSFNELVIYARRNLEWGYLIPVNLFWSEEHNLGDRDNVLMALDFLWRIKPGWEVYGTFFWDELAWLRLLEPWWGNKFIFQGGLFWVPSLQRNFPDFRLEITLARPWVYTHDDSLNTFTSAGIGLGFPDGPNAQSLYLEMNWWPRPRIYTQLSIQWLRKGSGPGSDPTDDYSQRDYALDHDTPLLLGTVHNNLRIGFQGDCLISDLLTVFCKMYYTTEENKNRGQLGIIFNW